MRSSSTMGYYVNEPGYVISAAIFLSVLDIVAVSLRFWARTKQREAMKTDDWLMLPATILVTAIAISITYGVAKGSIAHPTEIPPNFNGNPLDITTPQISLIYKIQWAFDLMLPLAFGCIKASFLFFYLRIFVVNKRNATSYLLTGLIIIVVLSSASFFFASLFQCRLNFSALWGSTNDIVENCDDTMHLVLSVCITGFILDIIIFTVPVPLVWQLNLSVGKKISIVGVFLLGSVYVISFSLLSFILLAKSQAFRSIVASLLRLVNLARLVAQGFSADEDGILVVTQYLYWGLVESGVAIVAACLPTLQCLIRLHSWAPTLRATKNIFSSKGSRSALVVDNDSHHYHEQIEVAPLKKVNANPRMSNSTANLSTGGAARSIENTSARSIV
ncbi:hypothetical protein HD806DRAFT_417342 [Xylariaceae sp. AK1471]|nr:hypothetical protein HD806DRAFT_417342 [Xylariaceae sp. AK1471]